MTDEQWNKSMANEKAHDVIVASSLLADLKHVTMPIMFLIERHLVECFFKKLKRYRRIATRYDKLQIKNV